MPIKKTPDGADYNDKITRKPQYDFSEFKKACCEGPAKVHVWTGARDNAKNFFGLSPESELLKFICEDKLELLTHQNTGCMDKEIFNGSGYCPVFDAYKFQTGRDTNKRTVYLAFFWNVFSKKWIIKSFKVSDSAIVVRSTRRYSVRIK